MKTAGSFSLKSENSPRILVVGAGAVGAYYGAQLAKAGAKVSALCRSDYDQVKKHGFEIKSVCGNFTFIPEKVIQDVRQYSPPPDYLLVTLKVLPQINVPKIIAPAVGKNTAIVLLQNGIDIEKPVARAFPENEIISGLAFICVNRSEPGQVCHLDYGRLVLGRYPGGESKKAQVLAQLFESAGVQCLVVADVIQARWQKLVWNAPFNPISVLGGGITTKEIMTRPDTERLARKVMEEVLLLAEADGHGLPQTVIDQNLEDTRRMTPYKTSMLLDYETKRPMEVDAILGNAARIAHKHQISVPHIETLYALLKSADIQNLSE